MPQKSILIIGGGIAGLAAGCYAQMNGYRSKILEMHDLPGGLCTSWVRKNYTFDGCIHYLFGSGEGLPFNNIWHELGALQDRPIVNHKEYQRLTDGEKTLIVYSDPNLLEEHLCGLSPDDTKLIKVFCDGVRKFRKFDLSVLYNKPRSLFTGNDWREFGKAMMPFLLPMARWGMISLKKFASQFKDPFLKRAVAQMFSWEEAPVMMGMMLLAYMHIGNAGYPMGGSLKFASAIEKRYLDLGGEILYKSQVDKLLVKDHSISGVRLYSDEIYQADWIISACDGRSTLFDMLGEEYVPANFRRMYSGALPMHTMVQVSLGVNRDLSSSPHWITYLLDKALLVAGEERNEVSVQHYCFDPTMMPKSKSSLVLFVRSQYEYWQHIYGRRLYDTEQSQVSDILIEKLENWLPGISSDIEFTDEATPLSYERFTGNWKGSTCGFLLSKETMPMLILGVPKTIPKISNFYMAGQWVEPGGTVSSAAASGRNVIQLICHRDGREFHAEFA
jgi:phytoene dehydrogenase-like protein